MQYVRLARLCEERRLQRYAASGGNGHRSAQAEEPLTKAVRDSTARAVTAVQRLFKALDEAVDGEG